MSERTCTCDMRPPRRESVVASGFRYAIYLDSIDDDSVIDPACPFHGDDGSMVTTLRASR